MNETSTPIQDHAMVILPASLLAPLVLGIITALVFGDFSSGAGVGAFLMLATWVLAGIAALAGL